jgi:uncharacterized protein (TIGR02284 family)
MDPAATVETLNRLIEACKDGEHCLRGCAEHVGDAVLRARLERHADRCRDAGRVLRRLVLDGGGAAEDSGSASGALHRSWVALKSSVAGYSDAAMIDACVRCDEAALARYREALDDGGLPDAAAATVRRQQQEIQRRLDEMRALGDAARAAA